MLAAPVPENEDLRVAAVESYGVMDTEREAAFDAITRAASLICGTPIALITLIAHGRQWYKSAFGLQGVSETPRDEAICAYSILSTDILEVPDVAADVRFGDGPQVTGDPFMRFYAGMPLIDDAGYALGTLCIIDRVPKALTDEQKSALRALSKVVVQLLKRRRSDEALWRSERQFRFSFENAAQGMALVSPGGKWLAVNPALCRMVGYSEAEMLAADFRVLTYDDDMDDTLFHLESMIAGRLDNYQRERRYRHKNGHVIWALVSACLLRTADGAPLNIVAQIQDITKQKQASADIAAALEKAEAANAAKSAFLASMSHEIRTPLNGVIGFADLLLDTELSHAQRTTLNRLRDAGASLLALINDILDHSKIEAGKLELERIPMSPVSVVSGATSILRAQVASGGLGMHVEYGRQVPAWVEGDPTRVRQILLNLLSNALKFTSHGQIIVRCRCDTREGRAMLRFEVEDTGIGIPPDRLHLLFQDFSQIDPSTTRRYGGTGLGLSICKRLAEAMGGQLGVESTPGVGSKFWFSMALIECCEAAQDELGIETSGQVSAARILVAEDVAMNRHVIDGLLRAAGHLPVIVENGALALEAVQKAPFDLVLMDMEMPEMDGLSATRAIRRLPGKVADIPIIALTANAMLDDAETCRRAGMNDFLAKPIDRHALDVKVRNWCLVAEEQTLPAASGNPVLDQTVLSQLGEVVGQDEAHEITSMFRSALGAMLPLFKAGTDRVAIGAAAHDLVSVAGTVGCLELMEMAGGLSRTAKLAGTPCRIETGPIMAAAMRAMAALDRLAL
jgi:PAS domain S-box-containing protein